MFGFNCKEIKAMRNKFEIMQDWNNSDDCKRLRHLQTLIIKTYESVNIKADLLGARLKESFTNENYIEDFKVFFNTEIFDKLKDWCKEYEMLSVKETQVFDSCL